MNALSPDRASIELDDVIALGNVDDALAQFYVESDRCRGRKYRRQRAPDPDMVQRGASSANKDSAPRSLTDRATMARLCCESWRTLT